MPRFLVAVRAVHISCSANMWSTIYLFECWNMFMIAFATYVKPYSMFNNQAKMYSCEKNYKTYNNYNNWQRQKTFLYGIGGYA